MIKTFKISIYLLLSAGAYMLCGMLINSMGGTLYLSWLFWNLFLALLPAVFALGAMICLHLFKRWNLFSVLFLLAWLLFLPNACYMVTDLIHLDTASILGPDDTYLPYLEAWVELFYITAGVFLGFISGLFSTSVIHQMIPLKNAVLNTCWKLLISILCGYGVYIGRFLRLNSWDILHPNSLFQKLISNIDRFTILFTLMMAGFYYVAYLIFERVIQNEDRKNIESR